MLLLFPSATALKVGVYDNPPLVFVENGEVKGFYIDIIRILPERRGGSLSIFRHPFQLCSRSWKMVRLIYLSISPIQRREVKG